MLAIKNKTKVLFDVTPDNISADILSSDVPVVLKDFAANWPLVVEGKQSIEKAIQYLQQHDSGSPVNACYLAPEQQGRIFYNKAMSGFNFETKKQQLSDVLTQILAQKDNTNPDTIYIGSTSVKQSIPGVVAQTKISSVLPDSIYNIWLGNKSKVAAHFDFAQNLACCVVGRRRFTLFPPEQVKNLYIGPLDKAPGGQEISMIDFAEPDYERYPKFKAALDVAEVAELDAGDALILPSMWWHHVEGLDDLNVLLNHWWRNSPAYLGRPTDALHHAMLSIRDLPPAQKEAWKHQFEYYVFDHKQENFSHIPEHIQSFLNSPFDELSARKMRADLQNKLRR